MLRRLMLGMVVLMVGISAFVFYSIDKVEVDQISDDLFVIYGLGGNTGVLATDSGTVVIDTMTFAMQGQRIRELAETLTGMPVSMVINSHYHRDHTRGNPAFDAGTRVLATPQTLRHLQMTDAEHFSSAPSLLPNELIKSKETIVLGNKTLVVLHPGAGHTDGDLVVLIEEEGVLMAGDLFFYRHYPSIDLEAGGSAQQWGDTLDRVLEFDFHTVVPGHGYITDRKQLILFQGFMRQLAELARWSKSEGVSVDAFLETDRLTEDKKYEEIRMLGIPVGLDRSFALQRAWDEVHGNFEVRN